MSTPTPRTDEARRTDSGETGPLLDEMEVLERELAATERLRFGADADRRRLRAEVEQKGNLLVTAIKSAGDQAERAERVEAECLEQARLLGMSGEREADLLGKLERAEAENADLLSALKLMVSKFDAFIDSEYCGTDLLAEQLAQADFAREVIRKSEDAPFGT